MVLTTSGQWLAHPKSGASQEGYAVELVLDAVRANALERSRPPLPHRLEAVPIQGNRSTASWANDLALRFQLTKPLGERVVAARARHRHWRVTQ